ncbi:MAG: hypothetical protein WBF90_33845 [Rivularia sp. (in: cyanobacteria)]
MANIEYNQGQESHSSELPKLAFPTKVCSIDKDNALLKNLINLVEKHGYEAVLNELKALE